MGPAGSLTSLSALPTAGTCSDAVKEVYFTIYYKPVKGHYSIQKVVYDMVLQDMSSLCSKASLTNPPLVE